uniref:Phasin family protein n=1 Tax=Candidatus Kentrum sp. LFY TaxID=2126342 RepID=A0A450UYV4_9GAMM|nr:MAG: phasin family protein [Candidatus Kentron sp. LFY]
MKTIDNQLTDFIEPLMKLDVTKWTDGLLQIVAKAPVPGIDMDTLVASYRDDLEALAATGREAGSGMLSIMEQQKKIMEDLSEALQESYKAATSIDMTDSPRKIIAKQAELTKNAFEKVTDNMSTLANLLNEVNHRVSQPIIERVPDALDDIEDVLKAK